MRQMKQPLGVPCNGAQGSEGSQPCLSLWLSKSFLQLMMRLWGTCCFNGNTAYFTFCLFLVSSLLLCPSFSIFICALFLALERYFHHEGLLTAILPLIAVAAIGSISQRGPSLLHRTAINSGPAASSARCFQLIFKAQPFGSQRPRRQQRRPSCRRHLKRIYHRGNIISEALHIKHELPLI